MEILNLRSDASPPPLVVVRLGSLTLEDAALERSVEECHERWGIWGFSVLEVPDGDYGTLARLRPIVAARRRMLVAEGPELIDAGFPLLPTLDHPHWTVVLAAPTPEHFADVRSLFRAPIDNPAWTRQR
jgi:hypothetical protein